MSVSVDVPGCGRFGIPLTPSSTADDIILRLQQRLTQPWHGNKVLSFGECQLQRDDVVMAHSTLVLTNYSEISNKETFGSGMHRFLGFRDLH